MAEGITRNEADAFVRVYRKLSAQKKEYLFPILVPPVERPVVRRINYKVQKLTERLRWDPYEYSIIGEEKAMEYAKRRMGKDLVKHLIESGLVRWEIEGTNSGYIECRMKLLVATELENGYEYVEM